MANSTPDVSAYVTLPFKRPITKIISSIHSSPIELIYPSPATDRVLPHLGHWTFSSSKK